MEQEKPERQNETTLSQETDDTLPSDGAHARCDPLQTYRQREQSSSNFGREPSKNVNAPSCLTLTGQMYPENAGDIPTSILVRAASRLRRRGVLQTSLHGRDSLRTSGIISHQEISTLEKEITDIT